MAFYVVTGKLGSGKSLCTVGRIQEYLQQGRRVATNLDLNLEWLVPPRKKVDVVRLPDRPQVEHLEFLGNGFEGEYDEDKFGAIVLDECASWLNSRTFNDKGRKDLINWLIHSRKRYWDVYLIIQDVEALDKQVRDLFCEHLVVCRRLDRLPLPIWKMFLPLTIALIVGVATMGAQAMMPWGIGLAVVFGLSSGRIPLPRVHVAKIHYGQTEADPAVGRWVYRGTELMHAYDTRQRFFEADALPSVGLSQLIKPPPKPRPKPNPKRWALVIAGLFSAAVGVPALAYFFGASLVPGTPTATADEQKNPATKKPENIVSLGDYRISMSWANADGSIDYQLSRGADPIPDYERRQLSVTAFSLCSARVTLPDGRNVDVTCRYSPEPIPVPERPSEAAVGG